MPLNFGQLFNLLFCAKGFNSTQSEPDGPGLRFGSDTRAHCLNTGQPSSRCLFLNRVAVHRHVAASQQCFKAKLGYHKIQMAARPGDGMAGVDCGPAHGRRPGPRPGETTGRYSIFFFVERFNSPLSGESHSNPSQTARPGAYGQGSDTRAHRDCLNLNLPPDFSIGWLYVAILQHPSRASKPRLAIAKFKLLPGPATRTAWLERVAAQGQTFDTSDQVRLHQEITRLIPSKIQASYHGVNAPSAADRAASQCA